MTTSSLTTTTYRPGDLLRIPITFTNQVGTKTRPAVVVSVEEFQRSRADVIVVPLSRRAGNYFGDRRLRDWQEARLNEPTYIKAILVTVEQRSVLSVYGRLSTYDWQQVQQAISDVLSLQRQ